jgi:hypothetical protein
MNVSPPELCLVDIEQAGTIAAQHGDLFATMNECP